MAACEGGLVRHPPGSVMSEIDEAELLGAGRSGTVANAAIDGEKRTVQAALLRSRCAVSASRGIASAQLHRVEAVESSVLGSPLMKEILVWLEVALIVSVTPSTPACGWLAAASSLR